MRAPAATVSEPAFRSPITAPVCSNSTREASSTLPSSSPAIVTLSARTPPVSLAPASMVRSPWTLTSPLNLPAMRTLPPPSILPSMVMSAAISDLLARQAGVGACRRSGSGRGSRRGGGGGGFDKASNRVGSLASGGGRWVRAGVGVVSFQMDMDMCRSCRWTEPLRLIALKRGGGNQIRHETGSSAHPGGIRARIWEGSSEAAPGRRGETDEPSIAKARVSGRAGRDLLLAACQNMGMQQKSALRKARRQGRDHCGGGRLRRQRGRTDKAHQRLLRQGRRSAAQGEPGRSDLPEPPAARARTPART